MSALARLNIATATKEGDCFTSSQHLSIVGNTRFAVTPDALQYLLVIYFLNPFDLCLNWLTYDHIHVQSIKAPEWDQYVVIKGFEHVDWLIAFANKDNSPIQRSNSIKEIGKGNHPHRIHVTDIAQYV